MECIEMANTSGIYSPRYNDLFPTTLRQFMQAHPVTGERVTQAVLGKAVGVRPQTISQYANGETAPAPSVLLKIADYFGVTTDYLLTGRKVENKPVHELLGLSEQTCQNMQLVRDGYFEDTPAMLPALDLLLSSKDFYLALEKAMYWYDEKQGATDEYKEYCDWKASQYMTGFLMDFFNRNLESIYEQRELMYKDFKQKRGADDGEHTQEG